METEYETLEPLTDEEETRLQAEVNSDLDALIAHYRALAGKHQDESDNSEQCPW